MKVKLSPGEVVMLTAHTHVEIEIPSHVAVEKSGGYTFTVGAGGSSGGGGGGGGGGGAATSDARAGGGGAGGSAHGG